MPNVHELIRDHVTLSIRCLDRLYLHAYLPKLQTSGGLCYFLRDHLGHPIPSPALSRERPNSSRKAFAPTTMPSARFRQFHLHFSIHRPSRRQARETSPAPTS